VLAVVAAGAGGTDTGAVLLLAVGPDGNWVSIFMLTSPDPHSYDYFGRSTTVTFDFVFVVHRAATRSRNRTIPVNIP
jgi:hypothetical protein